jgi:hypothetical protein
MANIVQFVDNTLRGYKNNDNDVLFLVFANTKNGGSQFHRFSAFAITFLQFVYHNISFR